MAKQKLLVYRTLTQLWPDGKICTYREFVENGFVSVDCIEDGKEYITQIAQPWAEIITEENGS